MKAAIYTKYGPAEVLQIKDVAKPVPKNNEVLIKVYASTVNRTDCGMRSAQYFVSRLFTGLLKPRRQIAGSEFAGKIAAVGRDVSNFKISDKVFGFEDVRSGGHAEFMTLAANGSLAKMPAGFSYQAIAPAGEGATYALNYIRAAGIKRGNRVLVYGASGAIGSAGVQLLKAVGADVTAVCGTKNVNLMKSIGADTVIDYQKQDFTQTQLKYDLVFDAVGKSSYGACKGLLKPTGKYCSSELGRYAQNPGLALWFTITGSRRVLFPIPKINQVTMQDIADQLRAGSYRPLIDRTYSIDEIVAATRYVETGQKTGNVVIKIA